MAASGLVIAVPWTGLRELAPALAGLVAINAGLIRALKLPLLYDTGVRYLREEVVHGRPREVWLTAPLIIQRGFGDCEDLAGYRAGELQVQGIQAIAIAKPSSVGFHIVVQWPDGRIEDPSRKLGM
jgi:hypothetical protein